jgi:hypothetical protein
MSGVASQGRDKQTWALTKVFRSQNNKQKLTKKCKQNPQSTRNCFTNTNIDGRNGGRCEKRQISRVIKIRI